MSLETNYQLITSHRQYSYHTFKKNGFYISNLFEDNAAMDCVDSLFQQIHHSEILSKGLKEKVFNEKKTPEESNGRFMIPFNKLESEAEENPNYNNIVQLTNQLGNILVGTINNQLGYNINNVDYIPTILETLDNSTEAQIIHVDMSYDSVYEEQVLVLIALQDDTSIRIISGSHDFPTLNEYYYDPNTVYQIPSIVNLLKGEFVVVHPKLFHSGWTANSNNVRVHYYFGLNNFYKNQEHNTENTTYFLDEQLYIIFNGSERTKHCKTMSSNYHSKKRDAKDLKTSYFKKKKSKV